MYISTINNAKNPPKRSKDMIESLLEQKFSLSSGLRNK